MPILEGINMRLEPAPLAKAINQGRHNARLEKSVAACLESAASHIKPKAIYDYFEVEQAGEGRVVVRARDGRPVELNVGPRADLLSSASMVQVGVDTIGPDLEKEISRLNRTGDMYTGYVLDCVGVALLAEVGNALDRAAEKEAALRHWGVGHRLAPGSLTGWEMTDQPVLAGILDLDQIGVVVNTSGVLVPHKSAISLIGMGPGYTSGKVARVCRFCLRAKECWIKDT